MKRNVTEKGQKMRGVMKKARELFALCLMAGLLLSGCQKKAREKTSGGGVLSSVSSGLGALAGKAQSGLGSLAESGKVALQKADDTLNSEETRATLAASGETIIAGTQAAADFMQRQMAAAQQQLSAMNPEEALVWFQSRLPKDVTFQPCKNLAAAQENLHSLGAQANISEIKFHNFSRDLDILDAIGFVVNFANALNPAAIALDIAIDLAPEMLTKIGFAYGIFSIQGRILVIRMEKGDAEFAVVT